MRPTKALKKPGGVKADLKSEGRGALRWFDLETSDRCMNPPCRTDRRCNPPNDVAIRQTLKDAGVEFVDENGGGAGVPLKNPAKKRT